MCSQGKRFGSTRGGKEGHPIPGLPLQWTDLQTALEQEQKKTTKLQEQLDKLREENFAQANECEFTHACFCLCKNFVQAIECEFAHVASFIVFLGGGRGVGHFLLEPLCSGN
jgi:hypothetical protein